MSKLSNLTFAAVAPLVIGLAGCPKPGLQQQETQDTALMTLEDSLSKRVLEATCVAGLTDMSFPEIQHRLDGNPSDQEYVRSPETHELKRVVGETEVASILLCDGNEQHASQKTCMEVTATAMANYPDITTLQIQVIEGQIDPTSPHSTDELGWGNGLKEAYFTRAGTPIEAARIGANEATMNYGHIVSQEDFAGSYYFGTEGKFLPKDDNGGIPPVVGGHWLLTRGEDAFLKTMSAAMVELSSQPRFANLTANTVLIPNTTKPREVCEY